MANLESPAGNHIASFFLIKNSLFFCWSVYPLLLSALKCIEAAHFLHVRCNHQQKSTFPRKDHILLNCT